MVPLRFRGVRSTGQRPGRARTGHLPLKGSLLNDARCLDVVTAPDTRAIRCPTISGGWWHIDERPFEYRWAGPARPSLRVGEARLQRPAYLSLPSPFTLGRVRGTTPRCPVGGRDRTRCTAHRRWRPDGSGN